MAPMYREPALAVLDPNRLRQYRTCWLALASEWKARASIGSTSKAIMLRLRAQRALSAAWEIDRLLGDRYQPDGHPADGDGRPASREHPPERIPRG